MTRRLLPILFAVFALVLSLHQASAGGHVDAVEHATMHAVDADLAADHPLHSTGCCTAGFGIPLPGFTAAFYGIHKSTYAFDAGGMPAYPHLRSKHFRPPRRA